MSEDEIIISADQYISAAKRLFEQDGEIEVDEDTGILPTGRVSRSEDQEGEQGAYVMAWVYVSKEEASKEWELYR